MKQYKISKKVHNRIPIPRLYINQFVYFELTKSQREIEAKKPPPFYGMTLMIWWNNSPVQSFRCFDQFSESYEVTKFRIRRELRHIHECQEHFSPGFLCTFLLIHRKKTFQTVLWFLWIFLMNILSCEILND